MKNTVNHNDNGKCKRLKRTLRWAVLIAVFAVLILVLPSLYVKWSGSRHITGPTGCPQSQAAIVLGAGVKPGGKLSPILADRVNTSINLYKSGKVSKLLMTGDHGRVNYDEVNAMRLFAGKRGVPPQDIFMDHAGFCTYDSMYRAKAVFHVKSAVVVTQQFHLPRSVYLARTLGIEACGVKSDKRRYRGALMLEFRETLARFQDFVRAQVLRPKPKYLGDPIPITGDGRATRG